MPPQCLNLFHTAAPAPKAQQTLHRMGREKQKKKGRGQQHSHGYSHRQEGGICPRPAPSNLRERPFSSRGGNTAGFKEEKIPAGLHTHSGAGGKAAQSRDLRVQRGRMQGCHGDGDGSPGMEFWGGCGHCSWPQRKQQ